MALTDMVPSNFRIAVLCGGRSGEREVSLNSGANVANALTQAGYQVTILDPIYNTFITDLMQDPPDVVFPVLHGRFGEDGTIQGLCKLLGLPYVGSGVMSSALAINKIMSKRIYQSRNMRTAPFIELRNAHDFDMEAAVALATEQLGEKTVVKPAKEGSSLGMSIVHDATELPEAITLAFQHDKHVLVEQFITGTEVTIPVLGNEKPRALPTIEVIAEHEFYDYASKYEPGMSQHIIPARVGDEINERASQLAVEAHTALGCKGFSRSDFIVDANEDIWIIETNTLPGMTDTSLVPDSAASAGIDMQTLCTMLVQFALDD